MTTARDLLQAHHDVDKVKRDLPLLEIGIGGLRIGLRGCPDIAGTMRGEHIGLTVQTSGGSDVLLNGERIEALRDKLNEWFPKGGSDVAG